MNTETYNEMFEELTGPDGFFEGQPENLKDIELEILQSMYAQFSSKACAELKELCAPHWAAKEAETA